MGTVPSSRSTFVMTIISNTFVPPPRDIHTKSILVAIVHNVKHNPNYPVFQYADTHKVVHRVIWNQIAGALQTVVRLVEQHCEGSPNSSGQHVIGILANLDTITYFCLMFGIILSGHVAFPISLRNSPEGIAHLVSTTKCNFVFTTEDQRTQDLCNASIHIPDGMKVPTYTIPGFATLLVPPVGDGSISLELPRNIRSQDMCIIYHSSGSTGHPKPIYQSHEFVAKWSIDTAYRDPGVDTTSEIVSIHALPFYHILPNVITLSCIMGGTIAAVLDPAQDLFASSPESIFAATVASLSNKILTIPSFVEAWSKIPENVETLKKFTSVLYAGAPISYEVAKALFQAGVNLCTTYGSTETGSLAVFTPTDVRRSYGWDWVKFSPEIDIVYIPHDDGLYKLLVKENEYRKLAAYNTTVDGVPAYDTKDIVERHPTNPSLCRVRNRQDTLIVHSSGEKTNPIPIEECLQQDERIAAAVMFGREKPLAGVIILPAEGCSIDTMDGNSVKRYCDLIWNTVLDANEKSPAHSRIFKEMIIVANSNRPFEYTEKGIPKRHSILNEYREDIQKLYADVESGAVNNDYDLTVTDGSDLDVAKHFIRTMFHLTLSKKLKRTIDDNDDIFQFGADSLSAMSIRASILRMLSSKLPSAEKENARSLLPPDLVFSYPTINSLSAKISQFQFWGTVKDSYLAKNNEDETDNYASRLAKSGSYSIDNLSTLSGMVKFKDGKGDIPIILIPDVAGSAGIFLASYHLYQSTVWACDTTRVAPDAFSSMQDLVLFYLTQIISERPVGPYRFASHSGSCAVLQCIVKHLEQSGQDVLQVAYLDHYPNHYLHHIDNPSTFNPNISDTELDNYLRNNIRFIHRMWCASQYPKETIDWYIKTYEAVLEDKPVDPKIQPVMQRVWNTIGIIIKFLFGDEFRVNGEWSRDLYDAWLKSMKVVPTVYLADRGIASLSENPEKEFATGLGVKEAYPSARVVIVPGEHNDVLCDKVAIADQEKGFV